MHLLIYTEETIKDVMEKLSIVVVDTFVFVTKLP